MSLLTSSIGDGAAGHARFRLAGFRSPQQCGALGRLLPPRWAEGVGVQHIKLYAFDDDVVLTGANLSNDYFTNRQDRCVRVCGDATFAAAVHECVDAMYDVSVKPHEFGKPSAEQDRTAAFAEYLASAFGPPRTPPSARPPQQAPLVSAASPSLPADMVAITPLAQFAPHRVNQDEQTMLWLFRSCAPTATLHIASGYFNMPPQYVDALMRCPAAGVSILTAAPSANGFHGSAGAATACLLPHWGC